MLTEDPWVMAAEIAAASVAGRDPRSVRRGMQVIGGGNHQPFDVSELASALGTSELFAGSDRSARRLFRQSLVAPTDNAVAQYAWAARQTTGLDVKPEQLLGPWRYEARAWQHLVKQEWAQTAEQCAAWLNDEAFSTRPALLGSFVSLVTLEEFSLGEAFARRGLLANPADQGLLNNLTVSLIGQGKLADAEELFRAIPQGKGPLPVAATLRATEGMLRFRQGDLAGGRAAYEEAIGMLNGTTEKRTLALAALHLAREELLARTPGAIATLARAEELSTATKAPEVETMLTRVRDMAAAAPASSWVIHHP